jgi:hypothetical protein
VPCPRHITRRAALFVVGALASLALLAVSAGRSRSAGAEASTPPVRGAILPDTLAFDVEYAGISAEGLDLIWRGRADGPVPGQVTVRVEYAGAQSDHQMPVWPVNAWLFYSADDFRSSFAAELSGSLNWRTGQLHVTGLVSDGIRLDVPLEQRIHLRRPGLGGRATVIFLPRLTLLDALAGEF